MRKRLNGMLAILLLAVCFPSMAKSLVDSVCNTQGGTVPLKSVNLKLSEVTTGKILYTSPAYAISYTCTVYPSLGTDYAPSLAFTDSFMNVIRNLSNIGLGMNLIIQETDKGSVTIPWSDIKNAPVSFRKQFGATMSDRLQNLPSAGSGYSRKATVSVELFVEAAFVQNKILVLDTPSMDAFNIMPVADGNGKKGTPVKTGAFSIRFLPENLGRVSVSPSLVRLGHFYTTIDSTLSKTAAFTVTAQQATGTATPFTVPLLINFIPTTALAITDEQYIQLSTGGQNNGLRLSVRDDAGNNVKFNTPASMGSLNMIGSPGNRIQKTYTAVVDRIPGTDLKTGDFSASMSVVVTYN